MKAPLLDVAPIASITPSALTAVTTPNWSLAACPARLPDSAPVPASASAGSARAPTVATITLMTRRRQDQITRTPQTDSMARGTEPTGGQWYRLCPCATPGL